MTEIAATFGSRGHGTGAWNAQIRGNEKSASEYQGLRVGGAMPQGAVLVELHTDKSGVPLDGFVMEKREAGYFPAGGDWDYAVIGHEGELQQRGKLDFCARCHAEAPADFVFVRPASSK